MDTNKIAVNSVAIAINGCPINDEYRELLPYREISYIFWIIEII